MEILIGTSGWTFKDWIGAFYPADAQSQALLGLYCQHFRTVEVDSTFYGTPRESAVEAWRRKTPEGFVFSLKVPREITHDALLKDQGPQMVHTHRAKRTLLTADFHYVRWLGNRAAPMPDFSREHRSRDEDHARWIALFRDLPPDLRRVYGYFNNHYTGHSPAAAKAFLKRLAQPPLP